MQIDSYYIKLQGKAELPSPLEAGKNYKVEIEGSITQEILTDNQDGTGTKGFKFEPILVNLVDEKGERIKAKDTRSRSQQLRSVIWKRWKDENRPIEFDDFYDKEMLAIIKDKIDEKIYDS